MSCVARCTSDKVLVVFEVVIDVFASESFDTDVTVMKFLVVANRVAIIYNRVGLHNFVCELKSSVQIKLSLLSPRQLEKRLVVAFGN